ncbi:unnamed protein product [Calypogeia fissa]
MNGGFFTTPPVKQYEGKVTIYVVLVCIVAASGGLVFGYDLFISGGVTSMDSFLQKFFPRILANKKERDSYCRYDHQVLQLFTSSLYLAGLVSSLVASWTTKHWGRRSSMFIGGCAFLLGSILNAGAQNLAMLISGRITIGFGVGFSNQAVPLYLSEMAPAKLRGALNIMFQLATSIGIVAGNIINYHSEDIKSGWRLSLGLAIIPAIFLTLGGVFLPETPNNLIERNKTDEGKAVLERIRGTQRIEEEYEDIVMASHEAQAIESPFRNLLVRKYRPQLCVAVFIPFFQQLTGINAIMFYAPVLLRAVGLDNDVALWWSVVIGVVALVSTVVSIVTVDLLGRKVLLWEGGAQMFICLIAIGVILQYNLSLEIGAFLSSSYALLLVSLIGVCVAAYSWSWGPLGWLVPSELFPLEIRSAAQSVTVSVNFLFSFLISQSFFSMLCCFKWGTFLFFGGWVLVMTVLIALFLPETKNRPIEEMDLIWARHWYWKRFVDEPEPKHWYWKSFVGEPEPKHGYLDPKFWHWKKSPRESKSPTKVDNAPKLGLRSF